MKPHDLKPAPGATTARTRVGRGIGSGKGGTTGRGTKGTRARGGVKAFFEGGQMPLARRIPQLKGFKPPRPHLFEPVSLAAIAAVEGSEVGPDEMRASGAIRRKGKKPIKVLADGELDRAVTVRAHAFSASARSKIEAAGGTAEVLPTGPAK
jgi:large subunit ribosomal protein L15